MFHFESPNTVYKLCCICYIGYNLFDLAGRSFFHVYNTYKTNILIKMYCMFMFMNCPQRKFRFDVVILMVLGFWFGFITKRQANFRNSIARNINASWVMSTSKLEVKIFWAGCFHVFA